MAYNRPRLPSGALKKEAMGKDIEVAILFADVVGSTQLYEQLGDAKARQMVSRCLDIMREATEANKAPSSRPWATRSCRLSRRPTMR